MRANIDQVVSQLFQYIQTNILLILYKDIWFILIRELRLCLYWKAVSVFASQVTKCDNLEYLWLGGDLIGGGEKSLINIGNRYELYIIKIIYKCFYILYIYVSSYWTDGRYWKLSKGGWRCSAFKTDTETQLKRKLRHLYLELQFHVY